MKKNITTLEELEREQEKLKMLMAVTKQEFARNLGTNRKQLKDFVFKNVVLPAGAVGLGVAAVNKMASKNNSNNNSFTDKQSGMDWKELLPLGLNILQSFILKKQNEKLKNIEQPAPVQNNLKSVA